MWGMKSLPSALGPPTWAGTSLYLSSVCSILCGTRLAYRKHSHIFLLINSGSLSFPYSTAFLQSQNWTLSLTLQILPGIGMTPVLCVQQVAGFRRHCDSVSLFSPRTDPGYSAVPGTLSNYNGPCGMVVRLKDSVFKNLTSGFWGQPCHILAM